MIGRWYRAVTAALATRLLFRRWILATALVGAWPVVDRLTQTEVLTGATAGGASIAVAVLGLFGIITKLYLDMRDRDENR